MLMEDSQKPVFDSESAKSLPKRSVTRNLYMLLEVANSLSGLDIKMVGAWGFEPQTPTVSR